MGILDRFTSIMSANVNALFDSWEDPEKMVDQYLRDMARDVADVKQATAEVMGVEKAAKRRVDDLQVEIEKYQGLAVKAAQAENEEHARAFLEKKNEFASEKVDADEQLAVASKNAKEVRGVYNKLVEDMSTLQKRKASIKANAAIAKAQETAAGSIKGKRKRGEAASAAFDRLDQKTKARRDAASSLMELDSDASEDATQELEDLYGGGSSAGVDAELAALMASVKDTPQPN